jgi:hypothetical protein
MFDHTIFLPDRHDLSQPPNLRWRRLLYLIRHGRQPFRGYDDHETFVGWRYLNDWRACRDRSNLEWLAQRHPAVAAAHTYYRKAEPLKKAAIEARLLARQTDAAIADQCGLSAAAVGTYHDLFFNVRDYLHAEIYIYGVAIGLKTFSGLNENDVDILLKKFGYAHGRLMVDAALRYFRDPPPLTPCLDGLDATALDELRDMLLLRQLILTIVARSRAFTGKKPRIPSSALSGNASPGHEESPYRSVADFLREQVLALMPAGPPTVLPFARSVPPDMPEPLADSLAPLCG